MQMFNLQIKSYLQIFNLQMKSYLQMLNLEIKRQTWSELSQAQPLLRLRLRLNNFRIDDIDTQVNNYEVRNYDH